VSIARLAEKDEDDSNGGEAPSPESDTPLS